MQHLSSFIHPLRIIAPFSAPDLSSLQVTEPLLDAPFPSLISVVSLLTRSTVFSSKLFIDFPRFTLRDNFRQFGGFDHSIGVWSCVQRLLTRLCFANTHWA